MSEQKPRKWWLDIATPYGDPFDFISTEPHKHPAATNIRVVEHSAYQKAIEALKLVATREMDLDLIPIECLGLVRRARETLRELGEIE